MIIQNWPILLNHDSYIYAILSAMYIFFLDIFPKESKKRSIRKEGTKKEGGSPSHAAVLIRLAKSHTKQAHYLIDVFQILGFESRDIKKRS